MSRRFKRAWQCHKCPESNGADGCPSWWEMVGPEGNLLKGCYHTPEVLLTILRDIMSATINGTHQAAASADKATNHAATAEYAAMAGLSVVLGIASGQIQPPPPPQIEGPKDDEAVRPRIGAIR